MRIINVNKWRAAGCLVMAILISMAFTACGQGAPSEPTDEQAEESESPSAVTLNEVERHYQSIIEGYLAQIPAVQRNEPALPEVQQQILDEMIKRYERHATSREIHEEYMNGIEKLGPDIADKFTEYAIAGMRRNSFDDYAMLGDYTSSQGSLDRFFAEAEKFDFSYFALSKNPDRIEDPDVRKIVDEAKAQGYIVASAEGMLFYVVDFTVFAQYRSYNTNPMAAVIETLAIDTIDPLAADAALIVPWKTLAARAWNMEKLLQETGGQGTRYGEFVAVRLKDHMRLMFFGIDNTPAFDYSTGKAAEEILSAMTDAATIENMQMGRLAAAYLEILGQNDGKADEAARSALNALLDTLDPIYGSGETAEKAFGDWMSGNIQK